METTDPNAAIQGPSETGRAPKSRIKDCAAAYQLFENIKTGDSTAAKYRCQIQGLVDGNSPYKTEDLRKAGQLWRSNVNFREAESIIDTNSASIWELDMEVPSLINVACELMDPQRPGINYGQIIEREYTRTVAAWPDYFFNRMLSTKEMLMYGIGPMYWRDKWDWRPRSAKRAALLIAADSKAAIGELELVGFRHSYQAHELYDKVKDEESRKIAKEQGWNPDLIQEVLVKSAKGSTSADKQMQSTDFEALQQKLKNNDLATSSTDCQPIRVIQFLIKEYSGKVSRHMIYEDEELPGYLYTGQDEYEGMEDALCLFVWNIGDGYYRSIKGLGHRIFPHVELSNRFINTTVDGASMASSFILEPSGNGQQQSNLMRLGTITVLPAGFKPVQQTFAPNLTQLIGVRTMLTQILNNNTNVYKKGVEDPNAPERTLGEVQIEAMNTAKFDKHQINIHYLNLDAMHRQIFKRLSNPDYPKEAGGYDAAMDFQRRCKKRGVPKEAFDTDNITVSATRAIGYGSAVMRDSVTREVLGLAPAMDEIGRRNAARDRVAALVGYTMVDRYLPEAGRDQIPTSEHSLAMLENNDIMVGQQVVVGTDQPHAIHWLVHLPSLMAIAKAFMDQPQSVNLQQAVPAMAIGLQHLDQHLQAMAGDPSRKDQVKMMEMQLEQLSKVFQSMQKMAQQQQKQMQAQQQAQEQQVQQAQTVLQDRDMQSRMAEVQGNLEIKMRKMIADNEIKTAKAKHSMQLADMSTAAAIQRENAKASAQPAPA